MIIGMPAIIQWRALQRRIQDFSKRGLSRGLGDGSFPSRVRGQSLGMGFEDKVPRR